ncbi:glucose 1,6-bisphosphate synthase [Eucyclogobius newberryi]|uniref:glucose 1,6-bisphosphate synthase n=1 Tax=Eucyclogobius newberryi TaxID=166745 RepID=UPI003B5B1486
MGDHSGMNGALSPGPGPELQRPGLELQHPGFELQRPGLELQRPGLELQRPGLEFQRPGPKLLSLPWSTEDPSLDRAVEQWLQWDRNPVTRAQIQTLLDQKQVSELRSRLGSRLSFGTAGLRAKMGAGFNRINDLTVIQSSQGLCVHLLRCVSDLQTRGIVIGFDNRALKESECSSQRLAGLAAAVFLTKEIPVRLFSSFVPTPYVPFAVLKFGAAAGIMITASHNPKDDNGYKVYWSSGAQIISPHDKQIVGCIKEQLCPWSASCWSLELSAHSPLRSDPLKDVTRDYLRDVSLLCHHRSLNRASSLRTVHSSFHGVGHEFVQKAFEVFGLNPPIPVLEQKDPDPDFPTVSVPNPEEGAPVLALSLSLADEVQAQLVLATDPDADRLAVAEKDEQNGQWRIFSGNEMAALLGWWMLLNHKQTQDPEQKVFMLATTVSSKILQSICRKEGLSYEETLPGFKWIGNRIHELLKSGHKVLFSFEESIGFLCGGLVPEKDGVSAAVVVAEMATFLRHNNLSLSQQLQNIYHTYGFHVSRTSYVICHDPHTVNRIFARIRDFEGSGSYPKTCGSWRILDVRDIGTAYDSRQVDCRGVLPVSGGHMITFWLENGVTATLRTSGTEPKIKMYVEICGEAGERSNVSQLEAELNAVIASLLDEFLEPKKNHLLGRRI